MSYAIEFANSVKEQLRALNASQRKKVIDSIEKQLVYEPLKETRNRKLLRPNPVAPWELRIGQLRIFYDVSPEDINVIRILAIGLKRGNKLFISGKEIKL